MKRLRSLAFWIAIFSSLVSCRYIEGRFWVGVGNYNYNRGNYIEAISYYNKGIEDIQFQPWIYYNLGLTYAALGENESALQMWERAEELVDHPFLFYLYYNEGLIFFYQGLYAESFESFKKALKIHPYDAETKINLELALDKMRNLGSTASSIASPFSSFKPTPPTEKEEELLEFIKQSEGTPWKANRQIAPSSTEPDY